MYRILKIIHIIEIETKKREIRTKPRNNWTLMKLDKERR